MKKVSLFLGALLLFAMLFTVSAFAGTTDYEYEGELDIQNGEPKKNANEDSKNRVSIGGGAYYDRTEKVYVYKIGKTEVKMSVPSGSVMTSAVSVSFPSGMSVQLYRDGNIVDKPDYTKIREVGGYILRFGEDSAESLNFTIVGKLTNVLNGFQVPAGFRVISASLDDEPIETLSYVDMSRDGKYKIQYRCSQINVTYTLQTSVDHTAPSLRLTAVKNGYATGPVNIADLENGVKAKITLNGREIKYEPKLTKSGLYKIVLKDEAGNTRTYSFVIRVYFNFNSYVFFGIVAIIIICIAVYLYRVRKNMRVR